MTTSELQIYEFVERSQWPLGRCQSSLARLTTVICSFGFNNGADSYSLSKAGGLGDIVAVPAGDNH